MKAADDNTVHGLVDHYKGEYVRGLAHKHAGERLEPVQAVYRWVVSSNQHEAY
jgi:hypothetical protein